MTSTFVNDLRLNEQATGDNSGSWGTVTNLNLELIGEALGFGTQQVFGQDQNATTTVADGAADPARAMYFKVTSAGNLTATRTMTVAPNTVSRLMFIENATSGSQSIAVSQGSGANVTIPTGKTKVVYLDGAGGGAAVVDAFAALSVVDLLVDDDLTVTDDLVVGGLATIGETLAVTGVLTTTAATVFSGGFASNADSTMGTNKKLGFRDAAIFINSSTDGQLDIVADTEIQIAATTIDINGALALNSTITGATNITLSGELDAATGDFSGAVDIAGALDVHGAVGLAETTTVATNKKIQFRDSAIHISSTADGDLSIAADDEIDLTSTLIDVNGVLNVNGLLQTTSNVELLQGRHVRFLSGAGATIRASISAESNDNLQFNTGSSETARMTIDTDGNVGINTTSPTGYHNVNGNSAVNNIGYNLTFGGVGGGQSGEVYGVKIAAQSNNSGGATYGVFSQAGQGVGGNTCGVYGDNHVSSLTQNSGARSIGVWGQCINNSGANGGSPYLANAQIKAGVLGMVTQINSSSAVTNAAVVANNLATSAALAYGVAIHTTAGPNAVRGLEYDHNGTVVLLIASTGNVTNANNSYGATSDLKLKENISVASSQWDDVKAIQVKKYSLKSDNLSSANQLGVIAQDLEASGMGGLVENDVMPITGEDGIVDPTQTETTKQVKYSVLYMKAVKALQEAMIRIEALETKVTALENA